jgi:hypothetical protein
MRKLIFGCVFLFAVSSQAQYPIRVDQSAAGTLLRNKVFDSKSGQITGSPYFEDEFMNSSISGAENPFLTRYNAFKDQVEISYESDTFVMPKDERYESVFNKKSNYKLKLVNYTSDKKEDIYGYLFELLSSQKVGLYKREKIILLKGREAVNTYSRSTPSKYNSTKPEYYIKTDSGKIISYPQKKKDLLELYPDHTESITAFLKDNNVSLKDESDLLNLTTFLATL